MRLVQLKIKIKSLAKEARIIRKEERRAVTNDTRECLYLHRIGVVRREARRSLLAYGFLRGKPYHHMESSCTNPPYWRKVREIAERFGGRDFDEEAWGAWLDAAKAA